MMFDVWLGLMSGMILLSAAVAVWLIRGSVLDRRRFDASLARYAGRHQAGQPREAPSSPPAAGGDPQPQPSAPRWVDTDKPGSRRTTLSGQDRIRRERRSHVSAADLRPADTDADWHDRCPRCPHCGSHRHGGQCYTSAADLQPMAWTYFGEPEPAPAKHGAPDTGTLPRVRLVDDSTGEIRAVGDRIVAAIEAGEPLT
jgi:hypothetical protein